MHIPGHKHRWHKMSRTKHRESHTRMWLHWLEHKRASYEVKIYTYIHTYKHKCAAL